MQCTAHNRQGKQCGRAAIKGSNICYKHGGNAPQVIAAARRRLLAMVDPALAIMEQSIHLATKDRLKRIKSLEKRIEDLQHVRDERAKAWEKAQTDWEYSQMASLHGGGNDDGNGEAFAEPPMKPPPGYSRGDIVMREKAVGTKIVYEFFLDRSVLEELREHEKQLRVELTDSAPMMNVVKDVLARVGLGPVENAEAPEDRLNELLELAKNGPYREPEPAGEGGGGSAGIGIGEPPDGVSEEEESQGS